MALVVDAPVMTDMHDPDIVVAAPRRQPGGIDQRSGRVARWLRRLGASALGARRAHAGDATSRYPRSMAPETGTQRWRTLVLLYPVMNARIGSGLTKRRAQRVMGRDERAAVEAVVERLPAT